jgi:hypothetical protein
MAITPTIDGSSNGPYGNPSYCRLQLLLPFYHFTLFEINSGD